MPIFPQARYEYGFTAAGCGMLAGLLGYKLLENKLLGNVGVRPVGANISQTDFESDKISDGQKDRLFSLIVLMIFLGMF